jgi:hypothetical protein
MSTSFVVQLIADHGKKPNSEAMSKRIGAAKTNNNVHLSKRRSFLGWLMHDAREAA